MTTIKEKVALLNPLLWPGWLGFGLLWLITRLPYRMQLTIGHYIGLGLYCLPTQLRYITETNMRLCFPEWSAVERKKWVKKNFASLGIGLIESAMAWWLPEHKLHKLLHLKGLEHTDAALAKKRGIILLSPHFTCVEMMARLIVLQYTFTAIYRPHKKRLIAYVQERFRSKRAHFIPRNRMRQLFEALKRNEAVWYAYDIDGGKKRSVFAPFFGVQTASLTALSRIAAKTGALVVPTRFYRLDDNQGYEIVFSAPLDHFPSGDYVQDATRLNAVLEAAIRDRPEQYIWQYKRFKTRPDGEKRVY